MGNGKQGSARVPVPVAKDSPESRQRLGLLKKVHVLKRQRGLNDGEWGMIKNGFKVESCGDMTIRNLEDLVKLLKHYGAKPRKSVRAKSKDDRLAALRARCIHESKTMDNGEKRLAGLALKICGTSQLAWCRDADKLERLLAVIGTIKGRGQLPGHCEASLEPVGHCEANLASTGHCEASLASRGNLYKEEEA